MVKELYLAYYKDYDTESLRHSGANQVVAWMERLTPDRLRQLHDWGVKFNLSFGGFDDAICPLDPKSKQRLKHLLDQAMEYNPSGITIDHFRFAGHWEIKEQQLRDSHVDCQFCRGKDRGRELAEIAKWVRSQVPTTIQLGYFAVPSKFEDLAPVGQNHKLLAETFDYINPMLYHRMIGKPIGYIHGFTKYLSDLTHKPIVPTIAVKDMPDDLPDQIDASILTSQYQQAVKPPSAGVSWFYLDAAIANGKTDIISELWSGPTG